MCVCVDKIKFRKTESLLECNSIPALAIFKVCPNTTLTEPKLNRNRGFYYSFSAGSGLFLSELNGSFFTN